MIHCDPIAYSKSNNNYKIICAGKIAEFIRHVFFRNKYCMCTCMCTFMFNFFYFRHLSFQTTLDFKVIIIKTNCNNIL